MWKGIDWRGTVAGVIHNTGHGAQRDRVIKKIVEKLHGVPIAGVGDQHQTQYHLANELFGDRKIKQYGGVGFIGESGINGGPRFIFLRINRMATDAVLSGSLGDSRSGGAAGDTIAGTAGDLSGRPVGGPHNVALCPRLR